MSPIVYSGKPFMQWRVANPSQTHAWHDDPWHNHVYH